MNERFRELRKALGLTQGKFGEILGITTSGVSDIEAGRRNVTEQHLIMLSNYKDKLINIEWLRTGKGEMFKKMNRQQELAQLTATLFKEEEDSFKSRLIMALAQLSESEWELLEGIADKIARKKD